jgi:hypothetical protein
VVCVVGRKSGREGNEERGERKAGAVGETPYIYPEMSVSEASETYGIIHAHLNFTTFEG